MAFGKFLFLASSSGFFVFDGSNHILITSDCVYGFQIVRPSEFQQFERPFSFELYFITVNFDMYLLVFDLDSDISEFEPELIVNNDGLSLPDFITEIFGNIQLQSILKSLSFQDFPNDLLFIIKSDQKSFVLSFNAIDKTFNVLYTLPNSFSDLDNHNLSESDLPTEFSYTSASVYGSDVLVYGNVVLFSMDLCQTFHAFPLAFGNQLISRLLIGWWSFKGNLPYFNTFDFFLDLEPPFNQINQVELYLDHVSDLHVTLVSLDDSSLVLNRKVVTSTEMSSLSLNCEDQLLVDISYSRNESFLMGRDHPELYWLPSEVYLGYDECFSIKLQLASISGTLDFDLFPVDLHVNNPQNLKISHKRSLDYASNSLVSIIEVCDRQSERNQSGPGTNLISSNLRVSIKNNGFLCNRAQPAIITSKSIQVFTGCRPRQSMIIDPDSFSNQELPAVFDCDDGQCVHHLPVFKNQYLYHDELINEQRPFPGNISFSIIGGGLSRDSVELWSDELIEKYNHPSPHSLYVFLSDGALTWSCPPGSPCNDVWPASFSHAEYTVRVLASSRESVFGSYCLFETEFDLVLVGLPIGIVSSIGISLAVVAVCFIVLVIMFIRSEFKRKRLLNKREDEVDDFDI
ncbi:hypothetical protein GEMRC1_006269 [Eukaryota sp. GEM-RC1]